MQININPVNLFFIIDCIISDLIWPDMIKYVLIWSYKAIQKNKTIIDLVRDIQHYQHLDRQIIYRNK